MGKKFTAQKDDKYVLYQLAVQSAEQDVDFLVETYLSSFQGFDQYWHQQHRHSNQMGPRSSSIYA